MNRVAVSLARVALVAVGLIGCRAAPQPKPPVIEDVTDIGDVVVVLDRDARIAERAIVGLDGTIHLRELGVVHVTGLTPPQIRTRLIDNEAWEEGRSDLEVYVGQRGPTFFLYGEVASEGERSVPGDLTIFEAVMASSPRGTADLRGVRLIRGSDTHTINIGDMIERGDSSFNVHIEEEDVILVPSKESDADEGVTPP